MKKVVHYLALAACILISARSLGQSGESDQNPRYRESEAKYTQMADSVTSLQGTTVQETYRAIDYLADKREARAERRAFRRELRLIRARYGYGYYGDDNYDYDPGYGGYYYNDYPYSSRSGWHSDWTYAVPLALAALSVGLWCH